MFSTRAQLAKRTGQYGVGRFSYLQLLVTEFQDTTSNEAKIQVLANLANFAYDPINYEYLRQLNVIDMFLDCLTEVDDKIVEYAIGGICNLCLDKTNKEYILQNEGIPGVVGCLSSSVEETVLSAITTLMFLVTPRSKEEIASVQIIDAMLRFSKSSNPRLSNLAKVFLEDYCNGAQIAEAIRVQNTWDEGVSMQAEQNLQSMQNK